MNMGQFIAEYGYFAVAIGSFLEGEAVLLAGSVAASQGYLMLALVLPLAALASFLGDLPYFFAGRRYGASVLQRFPSLQCRMGGLEHLLHRHHVPLVLTLRFLYGLRIAGLLGLGMSRLPAARFLLLDLIGALIWSSAVCAAGYGVGKLVKSMLGEAGTGEQLFMAAVILLIGTMLVMFARRRLPARIDRRR